MIKEKRDFLTGWKGFFKMVRLVIAVTYHKLLFDLFVISNAVQLFK